jgi:transposase
MDVIFTHGAGLDVHQKTVMACRVTPDPTGQQADGIMELQECGTMTVELLALSDWLAAAGITPVAMESTGEYWKPLYNLLEGDVTVFLVNAAHVKQVPGRKTDKADARWLAKLMRHGLLQASFIPPLEQRDLRDLTRYRNEQIDALYAEVTRRLVGLGGDEPSVMTPAPTSAVDRPATPEGIGAPLTFARAVTLLDTIPGVNQRGGELLVAEWGIDMARFGTAACLAAWSGVAPGNDESAGQQRSGKIRTGNHILRTGLTQLAHAAARTKGTYLSTFYQRLAARRGKKRAIMAVARSMVVSAFHRLSRHEPYPELGANDFDECQRTHLVDRLTRRIERLGYPVSLEPVTDA